MDIEFSESVSETPSLGTANQGEGDGEQISDVPIKSLLELERKHAQLDAELRSCLKNIENSYCSQREKLYVKHSEIIFNRVTNRFTEHAVPSFWLNAMKNDPLLSETIEEWDEEALVHLRDIKCHVIDEDNSFTLEFVFDSNPYFTNSILKKKYHVNKHGYSLIPTDAIGTDIKWIEGKNLTHKAVKKNSAHVLKKAKTSEHESFFNLFKTPQVSKQNPSEVESAILKCLRRRDFKIGLAIANFIPRAGKCFENSNDYKNIQDKGEEEETKEKGKAESAVNSLLQSLGLQEESVKKFQEEQIDMEFLKVMNENDFRSLEIPMDDAKKISSALHQGIVGANS